MSTLARGACIAAAIAAIASAVADDSTPVPVNAIGDVGAVLSTGGWNHRVPIELPPAANGHVPGLAIVADHRVPDGPLGPGWRLDGLSRIERRSATNGVPEMVITDTFYVDGVLLYPDATTSALNDYRLEKDDNRVFVFDASGNRWDVYRDGWQWRYGEFAVDTVWRGLCATETRLQSPDTPCENGAFQGDAVSSDVVSDTTAWNLSRVRDPSDNNIVINYISGGSLDGTGGRFGEEYAYQHLPQHIQYANGKNVIELEYATRSDTRADGRSGRIRLLPARLQAIQVYGNGGSSPVEDARYELRYLDEDSACPGEDFPDPEEIDLQAVSVLHRIERATGSGSGAEHRTVRCIETNQERTEIDETAVEVDVDLHFMDFSDMAYQSVTPMTVNFDGDAYPDLAVVRYNCPMVLGMVCTAWDTVNGVPICYAPGVTCTVDISFAENLDDGSGQLEATGLPSSADISEDTFENGGWSYVDLNRDGATDTLEVPSDWDGIDFDSDTIIDSPDADSDGEYDVGEVYFGGSAGGSALLELDATDLREGQAVDVNGDGFPDLIVDGEWIPNTGAEPYLSSGDKIVMTSPLDFPSEASDALAALLDDPACTDAAPENVTWASGTYPTLLDSGTPQYADINGDGLADMVVSYYPCWEINNTNESYAPVGDIFSRVFYGDGMGNFLEPEIEAGPAFEAERPIGGFSGGGTTYDSYHTWLGGDAAWRTASAWSLADFDRSGQLEVVYGTAFGGVDGFLASAPMTLALAPDLGLPEGFGLVQGVQACGHDVCEGDLVANGALADPGGPPTYRLVADWTGDGYPDVLEAVIGMQTGTMDVHNEPSLSLYENLRSVSRNRVTTIHDAWGGEIALTYQSSALAGDNAEMPYVVEVIASVTDERGTTAFSFEGGYTFDGRFMGFMEADVRYESGRTASVKFGQSLPVAGDLVSRTEYRADGTIETFHWFQYPEVTTVGGTSVWRLDTSPPYFNPVRRRCDLWVEPGHITGGVATQSLDEAELVEDCLEWGGGLEFRAEDWTALLGWDRDPGGGAAMEIAEEVWAADAGDLEFASSGGSTTGWPEVPLVFTGRSAYPDTDGAFPDEEVPVPAAPTPMAISGGSTTTYEMYVEDWSFNSSQRVVTDTNHRNVNLAADDVRIEYDLDSWDTTARGQRVQGVTWYDYASAELRSVENGAWAAFDRPRSVTEHGTGGAGTRVWAYEYDHGEVISVEDPDGATTTFDRNDCGLVTEKVDPEGRIWSATYTYACRLDTWSWQGGSGDIDYDGFGREIERTFTPRPGATAEVQQWLYDDQLNVVDDRAARSEPRSAMVLGDGSMRLTYLDPWGRPFQEVVCDSQAGSGSSVSSVLDERACVTGTEVYQFRAWSEDGQPRMESVRYVAGEPAASVWTWRDAFGRVEYRFDPAPEEVATTTAAAWVETSVRAVPGETRVTDPEGHVCETTYDTLETDTSCEGSYRGGETRDALGRVLEVESSDHVVTVTEYDAFGRPESTGLATGVSVYPSGTSALVQGWEWSPGGRLLTAEDPMGNERSWDYDDLGRPTIAWYTPVGGSATAVNTWVYQDYSFGTGRWVSVEDVNGNLTHTRLDGSDRAWRVEYPDSTFAENTWNAAGRLASTLDVDGATTTYTWNADGTLASEVDYDTSATRSYVYDGAGRLVSEVDRDTVTTNYGYTWDGRPAWSERERTGATAWTLAQFEYDADGLPVDVTEGGVHSTYAYDGLHRRTEACVGAESSTCGLAFAWTWTAGDRVDTLTRSQGTSTYDTSHTYNSAGWLVGVEHPDANTEGWDYDPLGNVRRHLDEEGLASVWTYDNWGRVAGESLPGQGVRAFTYTFGGPDNTEVHTVTEPDGGDWTTWYDFAGRAIAEGRPDGTGLSRVFGGSRLAEVAHWDGSTTLANEYYTWDSLGHPETRIGPVDAVTGDGEDYVYNYTTTLEGRIDSIAGPGDLTTFDWTDGVLAGEDIDGVTDRVITYDTDYPRVATITTGGDRVETRTYERGMWVTSVEYTQSSDTLVQSFGDRDAFGRPLQVTATLNSVEQRAYLYETDARGRVSAVDIATLGTAVGTVAYDYYANGAVHTVDTDSWAGGVEYVRSGTTGAITEVLELGTTNVLADINGRDALGRATDIGLADGGGVIIDRDLVGRVTELNVTNSVTPTPDTVTRTYDYDGRGRLASLTIGGAASRVDEYDYIEPGWLAVERRFVGTSPVTITYDYDDAGNRLTRDDGTTTTTYTYGAGNVLATVDSVAVTWDGLGGMSEDHRGYGFVRGPDGSEIGLDAPGSVALYDFVRDAYGRQVAVHDGTVLTEVVWGNPGADLPLVAIDEDGTNVLNVAAEGLLLAQLRDGVTNEAVSDLAGSLVLLDTDFLGLPGSWGDEASAQPVGTAATERYVYAGLQSLPDAPYQLARRRMYDPRTGRFASMDPIGLEGGDHRFGYANGDPMGFTDPEGLTAESMLTGRSGAQSTTGAVAGGVLEAYRPTGANGSPSTPTCTGCWCPKPLGVDGGASDSGAADMDAEREAMRRQCIQTGGIGDCGSSKSGTASPTAPSSSKSPKKSPVAGRAEPGITVPEEKPGTGQNDGDGGVAWEGIPQAAGGSERRSLGDLLSDLVDVGHGAWYAGSHGYFAGLGDHGLSALDRLEGLAESPMGRSPVFGSLNPTTVGLGHTLRAVGRGVTRVDGSVGARQWLERTTASNRQAERYNPVYYGMGYGLGAAVGEVTEAGATAVVGGVVARGLGGASRGGANTVYRVIRPEEDIARGLVAKNPAATYTVEGHVLNGSRPGGSRNSSRRPRTAPSRRRGRRSPATAWSASTCLASTGRSSTCRPTPVGRPTFVV